MSRAEKIIVRPIKAGTRIKAACYSSDAQMTATGGDKRKIWDANTATWTVLGSSDLRGGFSLASKYCLTRQHDYETNRPFETSLHHEQNVSSATFSGDGKFLVTGCENHLYTWDISSIAKEADLLSDIRCH
ncbi:hypothetical protein P692DRAFT_20104194 [Suillus brevipes Sb2]|nr:hypothetical protein P692DRAFT_20104194 [Suillus brevipes Sb2]